ncbi:MAG TPA: TRAM domain-containing protein, partial [Planctomycetota bacterium]|nr:TRAM domain-containing protein [Planctomycetota bacterium]
AILKSMRRGYTVERYLELVDTLRTEVPGIALASDFIVGFPGETAGDFDRTVALMERIRFQNSFVFKYSPRPGTDAAAFPDDVPEEEKKRRHQVLLDLQERQSLEHNRALVGRKMEVLGEGPSKRDPRRQTGRTDTHQIVNFDAGRDLTGQFAAVEITGAGPHALSGALA